LNAQGAVSSQRSDQMARVERLIVWMIGVMGRMPTDDEVLDFIMGTDSERIEIVGRR
jgi:hypothetical protein